MSKEDVFSKVLKWHLITLKQIKDGAEAMVYMYIMFTLLLVGLCSVTAPDFASIQSSVFACVATASIIPIVIFYFSLRKKISSQPSIAYLFMGVGAVFLGIIALLASCIILARTKISIIIILSSSIATSLFILVYKQWVYKHGWKKEKTPKTGVAVVSNPFMYAWVLVCFAKGINKTSLLIIVCSITTHLFLILGIAALYNYYVAQKHQIDLDYKTLQKSGDGSVIDKSNSFVE